VIRRPPEVLFVPAHVLPAISPGRAVITAHDLGYLRYPQAHASFSKWYLDRMTRRSVAQAAEVIAVSIATRDDLVRYYGAEPDRISVIHHGLDHDRFRPVEGHEELEGTKRRYGLEVPYLLHVGSIHPRKNLGVVFRALAGLRARGLDVRLALAGGRGWRAEEVLADGGGSVRWLDYVADADLPALMNGASALVMPSLYEGFGMPVLEAMACGTPVVCSRTSSLPEVAGDAALLVDPQDDGAWTDALERVLREEDLREKLVSRGLKRAAGFTWERCARETLAVLERAGGRGA
jgi:glycosyltransferase involved in cell wall biosynthesis